MYAKYRRFFVCFFCFFNWNRLIVEVFRIKRKKLKFKLKKGSSQDIFDLKEEIGLCEKGNQGQVIVCGDIKRKVIK